MRSSLTKRSSRTQPCDRAQARIRLENAQKALKVAEQQPYDSLKAFAFSRRAWGYMEQWKVRPAEEMFRKCDEIPPVAFERVTGQAPLDAQVIHVGVDRRAVRAASVSSRDDRATHPGERKTNLAHLPPTKVPGLVLTRETCQEQADAIGPATAAIVRALLASHPIDRLRTAGRIVRLTAAFPAARVERACARAEYFGEPDYRTIRRILAEGRETEPLPLPAGTPGVAPTAAPSPASGRSFTFVRQASEFVVSLLGGGT